MAILSAPVQPPLVSPTRELERRVRGRLVAGLGGCIFFGIGCAISPWLRGYFTIFLLFYGLIDMARAIWTLIGTPWSVTKAACRSEPSQDECGGQPAVQSLRDADARPPPNRTTERAVAQSD